MNYDYQNICDLFSLKTPNPLPEKQITEIRKYFGAIPKALEDYYILCGGCRDMNSAQDFLLTPDGIYSYKLKTCNNYPDYCVFYVENQCCCEWAIKKSDLNLENPPVYETYDGKTWYKICDSVSQFLISHAYLQAVFSFEYSSEEFYDADLKQADEIIKKFPHVDADSLLYTGVKFLQPYSDTVIAVMNNGDDNFLILYSSESEQHFEEIDNIILEILGLDFPFPDSPDTASFTCCHVLNHEKPILYVSHDNDGYWQFLCGSEHNLSDSKTVSLLSIYKSDSSIGLLLAQMKCGYYAERKDIDSEWIIKEIL